MKDTNSIRYTSSGKRVAQAGDPLMTQEMIIKLREYFLSNINQRIGLRNNMILTMGISTDLYLKELLELRIRDVIDKDGNVVNELNIIKSRLFRLSNVSLNEAARKSITDYLKCINIYNMDDFLISSDEYGNLMKRDSVYATFKRACKALELDVSFTLRTFIKTFAFWTIKLKMLSVDNRYFAYSELLDKPYQNISLIFSDMLDFNKIDNSGINEKILEIINIMNYYEVE